jgi:DNA-binding MarR family transcriptional regulator
MFRASTFATINHMTVTSTLDDQRLTAVGLLMEVHQGLTAKFAPTLAEHGLSENDFEILLRLGRTRGGQLRMSDLAAQTNLTTSGITRVVDRLERTGLVVRQSCDTDRRGTWATITSTGLATVEDAVADHVRDIERWYTGPLGADQMAALTSALRIIRDAVRPEAVAGA